ncbi:hypothetical protein GCM10022416_39450 [Actinomadura keratinilytica]|uniref:Uncharacterized protein n=1 Tax=Actinomadura keratinilytica TaxID=547461 RepID=A0ABP7Z3R8_9ACTN
MRDGVRALGVGAEVSGADRMSGVMGTSTRTVGRDADADADASVAAPRRTAAAARRTRAKRDGRACLARLTMTAARATKGGILRTWRHPGDATVSSA